MLEKRRKWKAGEDARMGLFDDSPIDRASMMAWGNQKNFVRDTSRLAIFMTDFEDHLLPPFSLQSPIFGT
jgi:hypothetical protein